MRACGGLKKPSKAIKNHQNHSKTIQNGRFSHAALGFETLFDGLAMLVLDECDRLLAADQAADLKTFLKFLPPSPRQNLLLSATVPEEVQLFLRCFLGPQRHRMDP